MHWHMASSCVLLSHPAARRNLEPQPYKRQGRCDDLVYQGKLLQARMADEKIKYGRCAVVGASGAKPERLYGKEIDVHDVVVRMNFAPTKHETGPKHTDLVGVKTNL